VRCGKRGYSGLKGVILTLIQGKIKRLDYLSVPYSIRSLLRGGRKLFILFYIEKQ
jgi:hypothetical protein